MTPSPPPEAGAAVRPRVEGDREHEILTAALEVLSDVGYDRLTMDSVASAARASKATLYRRWPTKTALVIDALLSQKGLPQEPDTGSLRGDLTSAFCGSGGLTDPHQTAVFASVLTALMRDAEFAEAFRRDIVAPKLVVASAIFHRARDRGEIADDVDLDLLATVLPGTVLHRLFVMGEQPTTELITRVIDQIVLPVATGGRRPTRDHQKDTP